MMWNQLNLSCLKWKFSAYPCKSVLRWLTQWCSVTHMTYTERFVWACTLLTEWPCMLFRNAGSACGYITHTTVLFWHLLLHLRQVYFIYTSEHYIVMEFPPLLRHKYLPLCTVFLELSVSSHLAAFLTRGFHDVWISFCRLPVKLQRTKHYLWIVMFVRLLAYKFSVTVFKHTAVCTQHFPSWQDKSTSDNQDVFHFHS